MPECTVHLTEAVIYLSLAPKSNAMDVAYHAAREDALKQLAEPVPLAIRNAPTRLMKELHYGQDYQFAHDAPEKLTDMQCLPPSLVDRIYYRPTEQGVEGKFKTRLEQIKTWKKQHRANTKSPQDQQLENDERTKNDVAHKKNIMFFYIHKAPVLEKSSTGAFTQLRGCKSNHIKLKSEIDKRIVR